MNRRDLMFDLIGEKTPSGYIPAAFFLHFDEAHKHGQAAIDRHLEFFRATGMDFVKIQYEQVQPAEAHVRKPEDWAAASRSIRRSSSRTPSASWRGWSKPPATKPW